MTRIVGDFPSKRNSYLEVFYKIIALKNSGKFLGKHPWQYLLFDFTTKDTPPRMFSWEFSQILQNSYFKKHIRMVASEIVRESSHDSFLFYKSGHSKEMQ